MFSSLLQFCSFYPEYEKCKKWLEKNLPTEFAKLNLGGSDATEGGNGGDTEEKKKSSQKRGGKGMIKTNKKKDEENLQRKICLSRAPRGKKKSVTVVSGLGTFGMFLHADNLVCR